MNAEPWTEAGVGGLSRTDGVTEGRRVPATREPQPRHTDRTVPKYNKYYFVRGGRGGV